MKCKRCDSDRLIDTKEGNRVCLVCGYTSLIKKKKGNFISNMIRKVKK